MRIRTFIADNMSEAMAQVRKTLGPDAIIVSSHENPRGRGVEVRAAIDEPPVDASRVTRAGYAGTEDLTRRLRSELMGSMQSEIEAHRRARGLPPQGETFAPDTDRLEELSGGRAERNERWVKTGIAGIIEGQASRRRKEVSARIGATPIPVPPPVRKKGDVGEAKPVVVEAKPVVVEAKPIAVKSPPKPRRGWVEEIAMVLDHHGVPAALKKDLLSVAAGIDAETPELALGGALDAKFRMEMIGLDQTRPIVLVGAPGVGKTVTTAKLAARTVLAGRPVSVLTTDTLRAGAVEQLASFMDILGVELIAADTPEVLGRELKFGPAATAAYVDTPATNPFSKSEVADLERFLDLAGAEPVLVVAAGGDAIDLAETARIFAKLGAKRMIATRLDAARRLGSLLAAADAGKLAFAQVSITPYVAQGLTALNPLSLARLLVDYPDHRLAPAAAEAGRNTARPRPAKEARS